MTKDLRTRNEYFLDQSINVYFKQYSRGIATALDTVSVTDLTAAYNILQETKQKRGRVFVAGNGGSAAIADHLNCDFTNGVYTKDHECFKTHSLVSSMSLFSALANDFGYENTFLRQLKMANLKERDTVVLISSSGSSKNIIQAAKYAIEVGAKIIGLTGFTGGQLFTLAHSRLHVNFSNYGVVEDCHQILMHVIAQYHYKKNV